MTRHRERERASSHFGSSAAPLLGSLCRSLASGGSWGVNLDCASTGAFPVADPACRFHGTEVRGNVAVTRGEASRPKAHAAARDSGRERTARPTQVPLTHMTRFVTKGGIGLHYLPGPFGQMDKPRSQHAGGGMDRQPERPLSAAEKGEYEQYRQRLATRRQVGRNADKLARIVDRYYLADETRCYVIRFPHEVMNLLKKARRIRRKIKTRTERGATANRAGTARRAKPKIAAIQQRGGRTKDEKEAPHTTTAEREATARTPTKGDGDDDEPDEVDWGSAEFECTAPTGDAKEAQDCYCRQPEHQPRAMATTMSPMRWTGGVLSSSAQHQQEKTPKQPGVKARTGEDKAVAAWGRIDLERPAGARYGGQRNSSPACDGKYNVYKNI